MRVLVSRLLLVAGTATWLATPLWAGDLQMEVDVDQAKILKIEGEAASVIIGNAAFADTFLSPAGLVIQGKSPGQTNMIILDKDGKTISDMTVVVRSPDTGDVALFKGGSRTTFTCSPVCTQKLVPGDGKDDFDTLNTQLSAKTNQAVTAASGGRP